jgi:hypothetical protein
MKSLALFLFMIALVSSSLQAQDVIVYTHHESPYKSSTKTYAEKEETPIVKPFKVNHNQIPQHPMPVGNFLNISHKLPKNSSYQIYDDKGVRFLMGRLTVNGVIQVKSLSKGTYKLHFNDKPILWFIKK